MEKFLLQKRAGNLYLIKELSMKKDKYIERFVNASLKIEKSYVSGNTSLGNKYMKTVAKLRNELPEDVTSYDEIFIPLLSHESDFVKYHAAYTLLWDKPDIAISAMEKIAAKKIPLLTYSINKTIEMFREGKLKSFKKQ